MLIKYGFSTGKINDINISLKYLNKIEGKDFKVYDKNGKLRNTPQFNKGGGGNSLTYMITPETFSAFLQKRNWR